VGKKLGSMKELIWKDKDCYSFEDPNTKKKYVYEKDEDKVLGEKVGYYEGKKKKLYK